MKDYTVVPWAVNEHLWIPWTLNEYKCVKCYMRARTSNTPGPLAPSACMRRVMIVSTIGVVTIK